MNSTISDITNGRYELHGKTYTILGGAIPDSPAFASYRAAYAKQGIIVVRAIADEEKQKEEEERGFGLKSTLHFRNGALEYPGWDENMTAARTASEFDRVKGEYCLPTIRGNATLIRTAAGSARVLIKKWKKPDTLSFSLAGHDSDSQKLTVYPHGLYKGGYGDALCLALALFRGLLRIGAYAEALSLYNACESNGETLSI